jgi:predicted DNA-binding ribbon-helix-helix protein
MPLEYFLGDNENAIKIQIFCALIADLLLKVVTTNIKRKWAYSNLASFIRLHLMNYTHLAHFLENPEKCKINYPKNIGQLVLNLSG